MINTTFMNHLEKIASFLQTSSKTVVFMTTLIACEKTGSQVAQPLTLQNSASFPIGFAVDHTAMKNNTLYQKTVLDQAGSITAENVMKPSQINAQKGIFSFEKADYLIDVAKAQGKRIHGHTFVWYTNTAPTWMKQIKDSTELETALKNYIQTVGMHFKGKVASWDVVNEAFDNATGEIRMASTDEKGQTLLNLGGVIGKDYVARMFQYAHQADPEALLFYNEYGQETNTKKLDAVLKMVADFKKRSVPVHGLGLQMHISINTPNAGIENAIQKYADTGLLVHISELDIAINPARTKDLAITAELLDKQLQKYKFVVAAYKRIVPAKQQFGITMWGVSDANSWIPGFCSCTDFPLLFDGQYKAKPAYDGFIGGLK